MPTAVRVPLGKSSLRSRSDHNNLDFEPRSLNLADLFLHQEVRRFTINFDDHRLYMFRLRCSKTAQHFPSAARDKLKEWIDRVIPGDERRCRVSGIWAAAKYSSSPRRHNPRRDTQEARPPNR